MALSMAYDNKPQFLGFNMQMTSPFLKAAGVCSDARHMVWVLTVDQCRLSVPGTAERC